MSLLPRVRRFAARHHLWHAGSRVVAAVSGGSDSVALLFLLHDLHARGDMKLDAVAHLNHQIRPEAVADEQFCAALAGRLKLPFVAARVDVPARAAAGKCSIEIAARAARRAFLAQVRDDRGADAVATAHTLDDQAETVLLRIARGTGLRGLGGIAPVRDGRIRPLLEVTRAELQDELEARRETWREDATNADLANPRNRVRHELLPYLRMHFNPSVHRSLARLAELARVEDDWMERSAADAAESVMDVGDDIVRLHQERLLALPDAIQRRVVQLALETSTAGRSSSLDDVDAVRAVASGKAAAGEVSGVRVEHSSGSVVLINRSVAKVRSEGSSPTFNVDLPVPGVAQVAGTGWVVEALGPQLRPAGSALSASSDAVEVDAAVVGSQLVVRSRLAGDRIRPLGLGGRKKVQDVFVDRKVNHGERDTVPIVTDLQGRLVWVAGHVLGEEFRVTEHTKAVIILKLRRI
jgi:tRNA(Ile)-lysidine synthase